MLDAVLCELEGVLIDSAALRWAALARALADEGLACTPPAGVLAALGALPPMAALALLRRRGALALDETGEELAALRAARYFSEALAGGGATLAAGAREAVEALAAAVPVALVARARRGDVEQVLALADLDTRFALVLTADDVRALPPDPTMHRRAVERLARRRPLRPSHVAALEHSAVGVQAALAAGVRPVRVGARPWSHGSEEPPGDVSGAVSIDVSIDVPVDLSDGSLDDHLDRPVGDVAVPGLAHIGGLTPARLAALLALSPPPAR